MLLDPLGCMGNLWKLLGSSTWAFPERTWRGFRRCATASATVNGVLSLVDVEIV